MHYIIWFFRNVIGWWLRALIPNKLDIDDNIPIIITPDVAKLAWLMLAQLAIVLSYFPETVLFPFTHPLQLAFTDLHWKTYWVDQRTLTKPKKLSSTQEPSCRRPNTYTCSCTAHHNNKVGCCVSKVQTAPTNIYSTQQEEPNLTHFIDRTF